MRSDAIASFDAFGTASIETNRKLRRVVARNKHESKVWRRGAPSREAHAIACDSPASNRLRHPRLSFRRV